MTKPKMKPKNCKTRGLSALSPSLIQIYSTALDSLGKVKSGTRDISKKQEKPKFKRLETKKEPEVLLEELNQTKLQMHQLTAEKKILLAKIGMLEKGNLYLEKKKEDVLINSALATTTRSLNGPQVFSVSGDNSTLGLKNANTLQNNKIKALEIELEEIKKSIRFTKLVEQEVEIKSYYQETIRLTRLLEHYKSESKIIGGDGEALLEYDACIEEQKNQIETLKASIVSMEDEVKNFNQQKEGYETEIKSLQDQIEEFKQYYTQLAEHCSEKEQEIEKLVASTKEMEEEKVKLSQTILKHQDEIEECNKHSSSQEEQINELNYLQNLHKSENEQLSDNLKLLTQFMEETKESILERDKLQLEVSREFHNLKEEKIMAESIIKRHKAQIEVLTEESNQYRISFHRSNKLVLELNKQLKLFQIKKSSTNSQSILLSTVSECTESSNYSDSTPSKTFESTASRVTFSDDEEIWDITSLQNSKNNLNQDSEVDLLSEGDTLSTIPPQETSRALKPIEKKKKESSFLSTVAQQNSTVSIENSTEVDSDEEVIIGGTINEITLSEVESSTPNNKLQASKLVSEDSFITSTVQTTTNLQTESEATNLATSTEHSMSQSRLSSTVDTQSETFSEVNTELVSRTEEFTSSDADNVSKSEFNVESSNSSDSEKPKASFSAPNEVFSDTDMETSKSFTTSHSNFEYFSSDESNEVERTREIPKKKVLHERSSSEGSFISIPKESGEEPRVHLSRVSSKSSIALETESLEFSKKNKNEIDEDIEIEKKNLELLVDEPKSNLLDVELELKKNLESTSTSKKSLVSIKAKKNSSTRSSIASKKTVPDNNFNDPFFNKFAENNGGFGKKNSSENQIASTLPPIAAGSTLSLYRSGSKSSLNKPASHVRTLSNSQNDQDSIFLNKSTPASINNTSNFNVTSKVSRESLEEQVEMMPPIEKKYTSSQHSRKSSESPSFTNKDFTSKTEFSQKKKKIPSLSSNSSLKSLSELKNEDEKKILKKSSSSADLSVKINNSNSQNSTVFGSSSIKSKKNSMEKIKKSPSSNSISLKKSISSIGDLEDEILEEMKSVEEKKLSSPSVQKIDSIIVDPVDSPTTNDAKFENFFSTPSQLEKIIKNSLENSTGALPKLQQLNPLISKQSLMDSVNFGKGEKTVSTPVPPSLTKNKSVASIRSAKYSIGGATQMNENNTTTDANISSSYMSNNKKVVGNVSNSSLNSESQSDYTTNSSNVNSSQTATTSHLTTSVVSSSNPSKNTNTTTSSSELVTSTNPSGSNADDDSRGNSLSKNSDDNNFNSKNTTSSEEEEDDEKTPKASHFFNLNNKEEETDIIDSFQMESSLSDDSEDEF